MTGLLEPVYKETIQGHAEVRETFKISKVGTVAGCYVSDGVIRRDSQIAWCATAKSSIPAKSKPSSASRTTPAKSRTASNAESRWRTSMTCMSATSSRRLRWNGSRPNCRPGAIAPAMRLMPPIGVLTLDIHVEDSHSLKEKRHVVKSLKDRLRERFNVSVAEIDGLDSWQHSVIAAVTVSNDRVHAEQVLQAVEAHAAGMLGGTLTEQRNRVAVDYRPSRKEDPHG